MTELLIAKVDSVVKGTDGVMHRLHRGRTIAEKGHPVVEAAPQAFVPFEVHLPAPGGDSGAETAESAAELRAEVAELTSHRDYLLQQLYRIEGLLGERDLLPAPEARDHEGWLANAVSAALDGRSAEPEKVAPPRGARKAAKPPAARGGS